MRKVVLPPFSNSPTHIWDPFCATPLQRKIKNSSPTFLGKNSTSPLLGAQTGAQKRTAPRSIGGPTCADKTRPPLGALPLAPLAPSRSWTPLFSAIFASSRPLPPSSRGALLQNVRICYNHASPMFHQPLRAERTHLPFWQSRAPIHPLPLKRSAAYSTHSTPPPCKPPPASGN